MRSGAQLSRTVDATAKSLHVLLVEDDDRLLPTLARVLRAAGHKVAPAQSVQAAMNLLSSQRFDALVTDIGLPDGQGIDLARRARAADPRLGVVVMTGSATVETAVSAVEIGSLRYLIKPFSLDALVGCLSEFSALEPGAVAARPVLPGVNEDSIDARFDRALAALWMAFQPIVDAEGRLFGYEALLRTDEKSFAGPGPLLDAAERLRRLHDLGARVRDTVATELEETLARAVAFVNLHPCELIDESLFDPGALLSKQACRVVLEITERATLDDVPDLEARIQRLRALGYRIALDDLGAGYAGLTTLASLRPDIVKLDMSLVRGVQNDPVRRRMVEMITTLTHELGGLVVGEGIEYAEERAVLAETGCDLFQGYLLGRPARMSAPRTRPANCSG